MKIILSLAVVIAFTSCEAPKQTLYLRKDGTYAHVGDSFKERW